MIGLPSKDEMENLSKEVRCQKLLNDEENLKEFEKGFRSLLVFGWEAYRISEDGRVKFITEEEFQELWQNQK